jgi:hypothetical protein
MKYFILSNPTTKEIVINGSCQDDNLDCQKQDGLELLEGKGTSSTHYVDNGLIIEYSLEIQNKKSTLQPFYLKWSNEIFDWVDTRNTQEKYNFDCGSVKITRNNLLYKSDWTQIANNPLTPELQQQWAVYRQQLRDITEQSGYPFNIIWPTPPQG